MGKDGECFCMKWGDNSKLKKIGWIPQFKIEDTLKMILYGI